MTELQTRRIVPEFDLGDRMRKALQVAGIEASEMADYLGYDRRTVSRWINGHGVPRKAAVEAWALRTGVDREWLETGCAIRDSNPEPAGLQPLHRDAWVLAA